MEYLGLWLSFVILATVALLSIIKFNLSFVLRLSIIPLTLWYGFVLFFIPSAMLGWPNDVEFSGMPGKSVIIAYIVNEPKAGDDGGIYLWTVNFDLEEEKPLLQKLDPRFLFDRGTGDGTPRAYVIPYSLKLHKAIEEAKSGQAKSGGVMVVEKMKNKVPPQGEEGNDPEDDIKVRLISPLELLKKD